LDASSGQAIEGDSQRIELVEPLQALVFEPESDPKYFAYGGEEVPLSVWDIQKARSTPPPSEEPQDFDEENERETGEGSTTLSGKAKKRKRVAEKRAKAKEYKWGEIWRAKNVSTRKAGRGQTSSVADWTDIFTSFQTIF
jgi:hypothetical protein